MALQEGRYGARGGGDRCAVFAACGGGCGGGGLDADDDGHGAENS